MKNSLRQIAFLNAPQFKITDFSNNSASCNFAVRNPHSIDQQVIQMPLISREMGDGCPLFCSPRGLSVDSIHPSPAMGIFLLLTHFTSMCLAFRLVYHPVYRKHSDWLCSLRRTCFGSRYKFCTSTWERWALIGNIS